MSLFREGDIFNIYNLPDEPNPFGITQEQIVEQIKATSTYVTTNYKGEECYVRGCLLFKISPDGEVKGTVI